MRITDTSIFQNNLAALQGRQRDANDAQEHLNAQKRVLRASDDPVAAARAERAQADVARSEAKQRAVDASRGSLSLADSTLGSASELMIDARQTLVQAGNGLLTDADRTTLANQLQSLRGQLQTLAGRSDGAGNPLFGGQGVADGGEGLVLTVDGQAAWSQAPDGNGLFKTSNTNSTTAWSDGGQVADPATFFKQTSPPAVADPATLTYQVQFSNAGGAMSYTVLKDGTAMGAAQPWTGTGKSDPTTLEFDGMRFNIGGTPANGDEFQVRLSQPKQDLFATLDQAIAELKAPGRSGAQVTQTVQDATTGLDGSMAALSALRSRVGEALNRADAVEDRNATQKLQAEEARSNAEDLDPLAGMSDFQLKNTAYDLALKTYTAVQKISIFNYISGG